jgi:signal transduction histidine kinase
VHVHFQHSGISGRRFPTHVETAAYRIVQEALTNVARYAGVKEVSVRLWCGVDELYVEVEDRGAGFEPDGMAAQNRSSGLAGMSERAALLGGQFKVESSPGAGTRLTAVLPLTDGTGEAR